MRHRKDIEGLRAISVIPVVLYHFGIGFPGGFVGVDVFFVISGYLITSNILLQLGAGTFSILEFYERRIRRIVPALAFMLIGVLLAGWFLYLPEEFASLGAQTVAVATFTANFKFMMQGGYWDPHAESIVLLHAWSLAVEEQFYIIIPVLLFLIHKYCRRLLTPCLVGLAILSFSACVVCSSHQSRFAFYMLPTRAWEILCGSLLGVIGTPMKPAASLISRRFVNDFCGLAGLLIIIVSYWIINASMLFPGWIPLLPVSGAALVMFANREMQSLSGAILALPPLQIVGRLSYSLYLWHWPVIVFFRSYRSPAGLSDSDVVAMLFLSLLLASFSWACIEQPFRRVNHLRQRRHAILVGAVVLSAFIGCGLGVKAMNGVPGRFTGTVRAMIDSPGRGAMNHYDATHVLEDGGIKFNCTSSRFPQMVILGDSHGMMFAPVLRDLADERNTPIAFLTQDGTSGLFAGDDRNVIAWKSTYEEKVARDNLVREHLELWRPHTIMVFGRWEAGIGSQLADGMLSQKTALKSHEESLRWLSTKCKNLVVVLQPPILYEGGGVLAKRWLFNALKRAKGNMPILGEPLARRERRLLSEEWFRLLSIDNLTIVDSSRIYLRNDHILYHDGGALRYYDGDHLNELGAERSRSLFATVFQEL